MSVGSWMAFAKTLVFAVVAFTICSHVVAAKEMLTYRLESFAIRLDPASISDTQSRRVADMLHAKLVSMDTDRIISAELAEEWHWMSPNILRVKLRDGYTFSNGQKVISTDVIYSLCRLVQPGVPYGWLFENLKHTFAADRTSVMCGGLREIDPSTLEIEVTGDSGRLLPALASTMAAIIPNGSVPGGYGVTPGAGPYEISSILANSRIVLKSRPGGPIPPRASQIVFQLVQDDALAATMFKNGRLDAIEISNPTLYKLLIGSDGKLRSVGQLFGKSTDQIRLLIFNKIAIARSLGVNSESVEAWIQAYKESIDNQGLAKRFSPLAIPIGTSYFPGKDVATRAHFQGAIPQANGHLTIIGENDPYSDSIASALPHRLGRVDLKYIGVDKAVLISRLIGKEYEVASITLEAMLADPAYWLAFFQPGSPFNVFGTPIDGLRINQARDHAEDRHNARLIDEQGNWYILFQERRFLALRPSIIGASFLATGLPNYARLGEGR